jgi:hypothetical protein
MKHYQQFIVSDEDLLKLFLAHSSVPIDAEFRGFQVVEAQGQMVTVAATFEHPSFPEVHPFDMVYREPLVWPDASTE